jgi:hypothetical protein
MTTFSLVNLIGWFVLLAAYLVKYLMSRKEQQLQKALESQASKMKELSTEELVELTYKLEDLKMRRFGAFGSYGVHAQILTFGIGVFVVNLLYKIL